MESSRIKNLRLALKMNLLEFAKEFGIAYSTLCNWESGRFQPNLKHWQKLEELCKKHGV